MMGRPIRLVVGLLFVLRVVAPIATAQSLDFEFYRDHVEPIFLKMREAYGPGAPCFTCHTKITSRFRLQPVSEELTWTEDQSRLNFEAVSRLVTPGQPLESRLLLHALANGAGGDGRHSGGKHFQSRDDPDWQTLAAWVRAASYDPVSAPAPGPELDFTVFQQRVQPVFLRKRTGLARCITCHSRSSAFRLVPLPPGRTAWTQEESRRNFEAVMRVVVPGNPQASRLLMMPLAPAEGGDPFHPGGRHWTSRDDPEWQTLASWVRGELPEPDR